MKYKCGDCGAVGVRLWRTPRPTAVVLTCAACSTKAHGESHPEWGMWGARKDGGSGRLVLAVPRGVLPSAETAWSISRKWLTHSEARLWCSFVWWSALPVDLDCAQSLREGV